jgi:hypothetical protein
MDSCSSHGVASVEVQGAQVGARIVALKGGNARLEGAVCIIARVIPSEEVGGTLLRACVEG